MAQSCWKFLITLFSTCSCWCLVLLIDWSNGAAHFSKERLLAAAGDLTVTRCEYVERLIWICVIAVFSDDGKCQSNTSPNYSTIIWTTFCAINDCFRLLLKQLVVVWTVFSFSKRVMSSSTTHVCALYSRMSCSRTLSCLFPVLIFVDDDPRDPIRDTDPRSRSSKVFDDGCFISAILSDGVIL